MSEPPRDTKQSKPRTRKSAKRGQAEIVRDPGRSYGETSLVYSRRAGVDAFVGRLAKASPIESVRLERSGVPSELIADVARRMGVSQSYLFVVLKISKATAAKKKDAHQNIAGAGGQAAIGLAKLLGIAQEMLAESVSEEAAEFDAAMWLGQWLEQPQPSLGGRRPSELLDTPTGMALVERLLRSIESGSYQ